MKTTSLFKALLLIVMLALVAPVTSFAATIDPGTEQREIQAQRLTNRLEEIKAMDTRNMSRSEKRALRTEVKTIKKELAAVSGGVYLSIGAILLIALLLILLL
jgi:hypothetical protein